MFIFFFQEGTSRKFLILLLSYFPVFWLQISSAFAIIFADCHGLSCVHVRASSYTALFRVSLRGVGLRWVGLVKKISARCNTGSYVFSFFFYLYFYSLFVGLRCVGMAQKISARCNTGPYVFLIFLYLYFYSLSVFATICRTKCYFSRAGQGQQQLIPLNSLVYSIKNKETKKQHLSSMYPKYAFRPRRSLF